MPELPEVETIKNQIQKYLPLKINSLWVSKNINSILHTDYKSLINNKIQSIHRKGKMLNMSLENEEHILSHLGMTGTWRISHKELNEKHKHLQIKGSFNKKTIYLTYVDPRRFGHIYIYNKENTQEKLDKLGTDLTQISFLEVKTAIKKFPNRHIKVHLLDQKFFAGSGNYIANEICARSGIRPTRRCNTITLDEIKKIHKAIQVVINDHIQENGVTFQGGYQDAYGNKGKGVKNLVVFYQKTCQLCQKSEVKKIVLAQRGTYYCPKCQK